MARLLTAGFESGLAKEELAADIGPVVAFIGSPVVQTIKSKKGSYALKVASGERVKATFAAYSGPYFFKSWFLRISIASHIDREIWRADAGAFGFHARVFLNSTGKLVEEHDNGSAGSVTGTAVIADDTWYEIRIEYFGDNTTGYVKVWVDGVLDITDTGIDTQRIGVQGVFFIGNFQTSYDFYYDDLFINDDQGSDNNTHIDDGTELTYFIPIADGVLSDFVPDPPTSDHYTNVDEIPYGLSPGSSDSLDGDVVSEVELLVTAAATPLLTVLADVKNINILTATWVDAGSTMRALLRSGGVNFNGPANLSNNGANVGVHSNRWINNPLTVAAWTVQEIDSIEIGVIITAVTTNEGELHAIGLYVEHIPPVQPTKTFGAQAFVDALAVTVAAKAKVSGPLGIHRVRVGIHYSSVGLQVKPAIKGLIP